jgi:ATP-dependent DNA helicase PIF1
MYNKSNVETRLSDQLADLLLEVVPEAETSTLSETQKEVMELVKKGSNVLVLGSAGCGKSTVIKEIKREFKSRNVHVTSTTGISAYNIEGITLHSFMGFGTGEGSITTLHSKIKRRKGCIQRIRDTHTLIIDEISMLSAELFEKVDALLRGIRCNPLPFGGIQVIFSGDLLQLKPVIKVTEFNPFPDDRLIFESPLFDKYFKGSTVVLTTNFRQQNDTRYQNLLGNARKNKLTNSDLELLDACLYKKPPKDITYLVPTNRQASEINNRETAKLKTKVFKYNVSFNKEINVASNSDLEETAEMYFNELKNQFKLKELFELHLKEGCRVMLTRNLDVQGGLVNGALGTIISTQKLGVTVKFDNGRVKEITQERWELGTSDFNVSATQIPLILAYAITIHKSQSLTLTNARIDLGRCFADHMVYVALSRVKSLDGLYLESFDKTKLMVDAKTVEYLDKLG